MEDLKTTTQQNAQTTPLQLEVDRERAIKMAKHFKNKDVKKDGFWVKYDASFLRGILYDSSIKEIKLIAAANLDDMRGKNQPTILIQLKKQKDSLTPIYEYIDDPKEVCPPPDGLCDTDGSIEN